VRLWQKREIYSYEILGYEYIYLRQRKCIIKNKLEYVEEHKRQPEMPDVEGRSVMKTLKFATTVASHRCTAVSESTEAEEDMFVS
jgi:hypothetical protein